MAETGGQWLATLSSLYGPPLDLPSAVPAYKGHPITRESGLYICRDELTAQQRSILLSLRTGAASDAFDVVSATQ